MANEAENTGMLFIIEETKETNLDFPERTAWFLKMCFNTLNVRLSNSQLKKLKSGMKISTQVLNVFDNLNDETNFPHKLLLTNTQAWKILKAF